MIIIVFPVAPAGNSGIYHLLFYGNGNILVIIQLVPQVLAAAIVPKRIILLIMIVATVPFTTFPVCRICIATYRVFHRAGLVDNKNNISGDIRFLLRNDLRAGGEGFQRDGVGTVIVGSSRLADLHATVGRIVRIGSRAGHDQRTEKGQAQKQR